MHDLGFLKEDSSKRGATLEGFFCYFRVRMQEFDERILKGNLGTTYFSI